MRFCHRNMQYLQYDRIANEGKEAPRRMRSEVQKFLSQLEVKPIEKRPSLNPAI